MVSLTVEMDTLDLRTPARVAVTGCHDDNLEGYGRAPTPLARLDATVFQFPTAPSVQYRINGSCDVLFNSLQFSCQDRTR